MDKLRVCPGNQLGMLRKNIASLDYALEELTHYERGNPLRDRWLKGEEIPNLGRFGTLFKVDGDSSYLHIHPRVNPREMPWFPFQRRCYCEICTRTFTRIRWTCIRKCIELRVWEGSYPPVFSVKWLRLLANSSRPRWKHQIGKRVSSVLEWLLL